MKLTLKRIEKTPQYTLGNLYIDNVYFCDVLEDTDRGLKQSDPLNVIKSKKIYGETAIPSGTYDVTLDIVSPKFKAKLWAKFCDGKLPRLINVPGYEGVLIHVGNTVRDSSGCLLVGKKNGKGTISDSTVTFRALYDKLKQANENISITIQ